jgi:hypothetical protein
LRLKPQPRRLPLKLKLKLRHLPLKLKPRHLPLKLKPRRLLLKLKSNAEFSVRNWRRNRMNDVDTSRVLVLSSEQLRVHVIETHTTSYSHSS